MEGMSQPLSLFQTFLFSWRQFLYFNEIFYQTDVGPSDHSSEHYGLNKILSVTQMGWHVRMDKLGYQFSYCVKVGRGMFTDSPKSETYTWDGQTDRQTDRKADR